MMKTSSSKPKVKVSCVVKEHRRINNAYCIELFVHPDVL